MPSTPALLQTSKLLKPLTEPESTAPALVVYLPPEADGEARKKLIQLLDIWQDTGLWNLCDLVVLTTHTLCSLPLPATLPLRIYHADPEALRAWCRQRTYQQDLYIGLSSPVKDLCFGSACDHMRVAAGVDYALYYGYGEHTLRWNQPEDLRKQIMALMLDTDAPRVA